MKILITTEAPDGTIERLSKMGKIITEEEARTNPIACKDEIEAKIVMEYAAKIWSAWNNVHIRKIEWREVE